MKKKENRRPASAAKFSGKPSKDNSVVFIVITLLLTFIAYLPALKADFVNWDDNDYVINNTVIHSFSNLGELVTKPLQGNYHPLTMISLAFNYAWSGANPWSYHLLNLILHLLNVFLVYRLASRLSNGNPIIAFATALLFGVHPMHVESVAWVAERKDVLYTLFFLLGLISYINYIEKHSVRSYILALVWFFLSLASKPAAIIFPAVLFVMDFFLKRKISFKLVTEKISFLIFSAVLAYLTLEGQKTVGATRYADMFPLENRIFFGFYGYMIYFFKMILPLNLVAFYPIPPVNVSLPPGYYISPLFFIATAVLCWMTRKKYPVISFGFAFYLVNLLLVLQFVVIGSAVIADRYTYVPYIGLFFIAGWLLNEKFKKKPTTIFAILFTAGIVLTAVSYQQASTWKNSATLWDHVIKILPSEKAYVNRAILYNNEGNLDEALNYYTKGINDNKADPEAFGNRGNIYFNKGLDSLALSDYDQALKLRPEYSTVLENRGALYGRAGKYDLAIADLNKALTLQPDRKSAYQNRGLTYIAIGNYEAAIKDFEKYLAYDPKDAEIYNIIGVCYQNDRKFESSRKYFNEAIAISNQPHFYMNRSRSWNGLGNIAEARKDAIYAIEKGAKIDADYKALIGI